MQTFIDSGGNVLALEVSGKITGTDLDATAHGTKLVSQVLTNSPDDVGIHLDG